MDNELIEQKLESLRRCLQRIQEKCPSSAEVLTRDIDLQDIVSINLTRAIQLCVDIGEELGCGAYMKGLRRTRSGRFTIDDAVKFTSLKEMTAKELEERLHNL